MASKGAPLNGNVGTVPSKDPSSRVHAEENSVEDYHGGYHGLRPPWGVQGLGSLRLTGFGLGGL